MRGRGCWRGVPRLGGESSSLAGSRREAGNEAAGVDPIAVATYSFWRFQEDTRLSIEECIDQAAQMGFAGVDILHMQMDSEENGYVQGLKRRAAVNGLDLSVLSTHQGFITPDAERRRANVDKTISQIELAYKLGIPLMRVNTGRWGTTKSFDELMANRGIEPPLPGYSDEDAFGWVIDGLEACLPTAQKCGVVLALENHWGLGRTPEGLLRIRGAIDSEWLGLLMDTGNFLEEPYDKLEQIAPYVVYVQAKTYYGGGTWYTLDLDYVKVADILRRHRYRGYVALEFEGKEDYRSAIPRSLGVFRRALHDVRTGGGERGR